MDFKNVWKILSKLWHMSVAEEFFSLFQIIYNIKFNFTTDPNSSIWHNNFCNFYFDVKINLLLMSSWYGYTEILKLVLFWKYKLVLYSVTVKTISKYISKKHLKNMQKILLAIISVKQNIVGGYFDWCTFICNVLNCCICRHHLCLYVYTWRCVLCISHLFVLTNR